MNRGNVGAMPGLAWAAAVTTWITIWPWAGFAEDGGRQIGTLLFCISAVTGVGILSRMARFPVIVVFSAQLLTVMLAANLLWGNNLIPTRSSVESVLRAFGDAVAAAQEYPAPVPASVASIGPLIVLGGLLVHLLVDLLAVTLARVPVAGLPLLAAYSLPISVLDRQIGWITFSFAATGFLAMLALQEGDRVNRWGRALVADEDLDRSGFSVRTGSQHPAALGAWSIVAALLVPIVIPTFDLASLPGPGGGSGGEGRTVSIENPMTDMKQDLLDEPDQPAVRVTTPEHPRYLRLAVLTEFTETTWKPGEHNFGGDQEATGLMPQPVGLDPAIPSTLVDWELAYQENFESRWLPTPMRVATIDAGDEWGYDAETLDFHTYDDNADTAGTTYSLTELDVQLDAALLAQATGVPGPLRARFTELPDDVPALVEELSREVTAGLFTQYDQAVALQRWFRSDFAYSLDRDAGSGGDALAKFLAPTGRVGYCEQFASAMAVMARSLGIPARVAVGFLEADPVPGQAGVWEFSTRDLHAWPELYFEGIGWVLFEPTPAERTDAAPAYTRGVDPGPGATDTPTTANTPTSTASVRDPGESANPDPEQENAGGRQQDDGSVLLPVLAGSAVVLLVLVLLALTPGWMRRRRTASRWATSTDPAETAWTELRDCVIDLGLRWPAGRSPRAAARLLARSFAAPLTKDSPVRPARGRDTNPEAAEALDLIVISLEQSRYAPPGPLPGLVEELRAATDTCVDALRAGVSAGARHRADWWPASLLRPRRSRLLGAAVPEAQSSEGLVDSLR